MSRKRKPRQALSIDDGPKTEHDLSEPASHDFSCIPGCGFCCLCQPGLDVGERDAFRSDPVTKAHILDVEDGTRDHCALVAMKGGGGSCSFLEERRCTVYDRRPRFCRQFPFHYHASWRVQVYPTVSCRGVVRTDAGAKGSAVGEAERLLGAMDPGMVRRESRKVASRLAKHLGRDWREGPVSPAGLTRLGEALALPLLTREGLAGIHRFLCGEAALGEVTPLPGDSRIPRLTDRPLPGDMVDDFWEGVAGWVEENRGGGIPDGPDGLAWAAFRPTLDFDDPLSASVYCAPDLSWLTMRHDQAGEVRLCSMDEDGRLGVLAAVEEKGLRLAGIDGEGLAFLEGYMRTLAARDSTYCMAAARVAEREAPPEAMLSHYTGVLWETAGDLWWKATLLSLFYGDVPGLPALMAANEEGEPGGGVGGVLAREAVIFHDLDYLDVPTMGTWL